MHIASFLTVSINTQGDQNLRMAHISEGMFPVVSAHIIVGVLAFCSV